VASQGGCGSGGKATGFQLFVMLVAD